jgi:signal transduction histidine kinase
VIPVAATKNRSNVVNQTPVRVLLVEDDEDDVVLTRQFLRDIEGAAFDLDWIADPDAALQRLFTGNYDVCLVDYDLGPITGIDFIRQAVAGDSAVPIILLTGQGDHAVDMAAMNAGAADFLNKDQLTAAALERSIRYSVQQHRAEEQRIRLLREQAARAEAEAANLAKDRFLAVLSHELRTPLTAVLLAVTELEMEPTASPKVGEIVQTIRRNADLEARLIDDLLDVTRIARGKLEIRRKLVDLHEELHHALNTCCKSEVEQKNIQVTIDAQARRHHVWGDPARLQQVLWNLIKNAAKFTPAGGKIEVRTSNQEGRIRVDVADTGIGIPSEALPRIFNAFEQADRSITQQFGGLGLGLAICKALVALHSGRIEAKSDGENRGALFTVEFPIVAADFNSRGTGDTPDTQPAPTPRGVSILLVEDHADTAGAMQRLLTRRGYAVQVANCIADAQTFAAESNFDILISDISLPDGTGLELIRRLRERGPIRGIALSGFGMEEDVQRSRAAGFMEHLTKPIDFNQLVTVIARITAEETTTA